MAFFLAAVMSETAQAAMVVVQIRSAHCYCIDIKIYNNLLSKNEVIVVVKMPGVALHFCVCNDNRNEIKLG